MKSRDYGEGIDRKPYHTISGRLPRPFPPFHLFGNILGGVMRSMTGADSPLQRRDPAQCKGIATEAITRTWCESGLGRNKTGRSAQRLPRPAARPAGPKLRGPAVDQAPQDSATRKGERPDSDPGGIRCGCFLPDLTGLAKRLPAPISHVPHNRHCGPTQAAPPAQADPVHARSSRDCAPAGGCGRDRSPAGGLRACPSAAITTAICGRR